MRIPLSRAAFEYVDLGYKLPLVQALGKRDLVFNGGYWAYGPSGGRRIQGLLVINDRLISRRAGKSGGVFEVRGSRARMVRSDAYEPVSGTALAIQCSPRLVASGERVPKLEKRRRAARTALCVQDDPAVLTVYLTADGVAPTLEELASLMLREGCRDALNLDGGPSTAAVARRGEELWQLGAGFELPYGIGVTLANDGSSR